VGGKLKMNDFYGSYINDNLEVVITEKYTVVYRKNTLKNCMDSYLLYTENFKCIGVCRTEPIPSIDCGISGVQFNCEKPQKIRYALGIQEDNTYATDDELFNLLNKNLFKISTSEDKYVYSFEDGTMYVTKQHGSFNNNALSPSNIALNADNVYICLQKWHLGVQEIKVNLNNKEYIAGVTINTLKHMYIFNITKAFIYCRAARYRTCNKGVVFDQNFRQNFHNETLDGEASIYLDTKIAAAELNYDEGLFNSDSCVFNSTSIYWSVESVDSGKIILHGCGGDTYVWSKPVDSAV
jgi:hypothetical protein